MEQILVESMPWARIESGDVEIILKNGASALIVSPNGTRYTVSTPAPSITVSAELVVVEKSASQPPAKISAVDRPFPFSTTAPHYGGNIFGPVI